MARPAFINELTPVSSLSSGAALAVYQNGDTFRATPSEVAGAAGFVSLLRYIPDNLHADIRNRTTSSDLSSYIQDAIDDVNSLGGGRIWAPEGLYLCNDVILKSFVVIQGEWSGPRNGYSSGSTSKTAPTDANTKGAAFRQFSSGDIFKTSDHPTTTYGAGLRDLVIIGKSGATSGRGVYLSQGTVFCAVERCSITHLPRQGLVVSGVASNIEHNFIGWNGQHQVASLTFYEGNLEILGADHSVIQNEVHGPLDYTTFDGESLANASLFAVACLVQAASCFISRNVFELADIGLAVIARHSSKTGAAGKADPYWPASCHSNAFVQNRSDFNLGHGIRIIATDSFDGPYLSNFVGNWVNSCGRNANDTYDGIREEATGANFPYGNTFVSNTVFDSAGAANELKYGINTASAEALQSINNRSVLSGNRVHAGSVQTAKYNSTANYLQGVVQVEEGIRFPATQIDSANVNTLDDYEEGTFAPSLTFTTPGDLNVAYGADGQLGFYTKIGNRVFWHIFINASTFTHSTASGNLRITGLPFTVKSASNNLVAGPCSMQGWTKANYTNTIVQALGGLTSIEVQATGSGQARASLAVGDLPTGTAKVITASGHYHV